MVQLVPLLRLAPYDRNPTRPAALFFTTAPIAPHASTLRFSYTVPTNRKALMLTIQFRVRRATAATTAAAIQILLQIAAVSLDFLVTYTNTADHESVYQVSVGTSILTGEQLKVLDIDSSTAGTVEFQETIEAIEFDA